MEIEEDSLIINSWLKKKSEMLLKNDAIENIFNHKYSGGSPNGSYWNPYNDLYIAIVIPSKKTTTNPKLYINGKSYKRLIYQHNPYLIWYVVKQDFWERET